MKKSYLLASRSLKRLYAFAPAAGLVAAMAFFASTPNVVGQERVIPETSAQMQLSFSPIVEKIGPAVVNVYASRTVRQRARSPFLDDPFFRRFFGRGAPDMGRPRERVQSSLGSGVIIASDGLVVTNNHVIKGADEVRVALADRREFDADVVLKDERTDLAILKINVPEDERTQNFPSVAFSDSDELKVGDIVLAIGNPFGVGQTVTQGIVSALARTRVGVTDYQFFIQTDAAINPGNSGGALVDMHGRLVGINTAIFSRSGGSNGIGFAIPANMVRFVVQAAENGGMVRRPWLGASVQAVSADIAEAMELDRPRGVLITGVSKGSPAELAGLRVGDLILKVGESEVADPDSFGYRFATQPIGGVSQFTLHRNGRQVDVSIKLVEAPEDVPRDTRVLKGRSPFEGLTVANLSPAVAEELRVDMMARGVVVMEVDGGSSGERVGFQSGDIILQVNEKPVGDTKSLEALSRAKPRLWRIEFKRGDRVLRFALRG